MTSKRLQRESSPPDESVVLDASIVIPTRNRCALLEKALDRLGAQTVNMARAEVIVVVDGGLIQNLDP